MSERYSKKWYEYNAITFPLSTAVLALTWYLDAKLNIPTLATELVGGALFTISSWMDYDSTIKAFEADEAVGRQGSETNPLASHISASEQMKKSKVVFAIDLLGLIASFLLPPLGFSLSVQRFANTAHNYREIRRIQK